MPSEPQLAMQIKDIGIDGKLGDGDTAMVNGNAGANHDAGKNDDISFSNDSPVPTSAQSGIQQALLFQADSADRQAPHASHSLMGHSVDSSADESAAATVAGLARATLGGNRSMEMSDYVFPQEAVDKIDTTNKDAVVSLSHAIQPVTSPVTNQSRVVPHPRVFAKNDSNPFANNDVEDGIAVRNSTNPSAVSSSNPPSPLFSSGLQSLRHGRPYSTAIGQHGPSPLGPAATNSPSGSSALNFQTAITASNPPLRSSLGGRNSLGGVSSTSGNGGASSSRYHPYPQYQPHGDAARELRQQQQMRLFQSMNGPQPTNTSIRGRGSGSRSSHYHYQHPSGSSSSSPHSSHSSSSSKPTPVEKMRMHIENYFAFSDAYERSHAYRYIPNGQARLTRPHLYSHPQRHLVHPAIRGMTKATEPSKGWKFTELIKGTGLWAVRDDEDSKGMLGGRTASRGGGTREVEMEEEDEDEEEDPEETEDEQAEAYPRRERMSANAMISTAQPPTSSPDDPEPTLPPPGLSRYEYLEHPLCPYRFSMNDHFNDYGIQPHVWDDAWKTLTVMEKRGEIRLVKKRKMNPTPEAEGEASANGIAETSRAGEKGAGKGGKKAAAPAKKKGSKLSERAARWENTPEGNHNNRVKALQTQLGRLGKRSGLALDPNGDGVAYANAEEILKKKDDRKKNTNERRKMAEDKKRQREKEEEERRSKAEREKEERSKGRRQAQASTTTASLAVPSGVPSPNKGKGVKGAPGKGPSPLRNEVGLEANADYSGLLTMERLGTPMDSNYAGSVLEARPTTPSELALNPEGEPTSPTGDDSLTNILGASTSTSTSVSMMPPPSSVATTPVAGATDTVPQPKKRGRPKGSRNKSTLAALAAASNPSTPAPSISAASPPASTVSAMPRSVTPGSDISTTPAPTSGNTSNPSTGKKRGRKTNAQKAAEANARAESTVKEETDLTSLHGTPPPNPKKRKRASDESISAGVCDSRTNTPSVADSLMRSGTAPPSTASNSSSSVSSSPSIMALTSSAPMAANMTPSKIALQGSRLSSVTEGVPTHFGIPTAETAQVVSSLSGADALVQDAGAIPIVNPGAQ